MNDPTVPPRIDGDASEPVRACERTSGSAQGHTGRFRIHETTGSLFPWCTPCVNPNHMEIRKGQQ